MRVSCVVAACVLALGIASAAGLAAAADPCQVTLDPSARHQTVRGWSCNPWYAGIAPKLRDQLLDETVNELGLTRVRWQQEVGNRAEACAWEPLNDDGDPDHINEAAYGIAGADKRTETWVVPFKRRVEANGDPFELWMSPSFFDGGSTGTVPAWLLHSPGEYAEFATSYLLHLKQKYGIEATHYVICNEAGNNNAFSPAVVQEMTKVLGARMAALGLKTRAQFPDCVNAQQTWRYVQAVQNDDEFWKYVDVVTYHWYGANNQESMPKIRDFALAKGLATGQTEFMGLTMNHLYDDLVLGGVSYWCIYGLGGPGGGHNFRLNLANTAFGRGPQFWNFRQVMHYVRPGAVRIDAACDDSGLRPLAFVRAGAITVVLVNNTPPHRPRTVSVRSLPPGLYGVCHTVGTNPYVEDGPRTVDGSGTLSVQAPVNGVLTVYPRGPKNLPPTVTAWEAKPDYLTVPASRLDLRAAAQDPDLDSLAFEWKIAAQPAGAHVTLTDARTPATQAAGLTAPGQYVFTVTVSDGTHRVSRDVVVNVYAGNQPPIINDLHNRIPVTVTLPQDNTLLRGGGFDLEGDKLSFKWSVVRQPQGAEARLETPDASPCKLSNLKAPGDYVLRFEVSDATHTVAGTLTVAVYPVNAAPVINAIKAEPDRLTLPAGETRLSAVTSDPDGDTVTHWWRVKKCPPGAAPVFARQGWRETAVQGLTAAGTYVFELTAVDRTLPARRTVSVTVEGAAAGASAAK
jgi:hypothetical protein